jgi:hypothetical protein
MLVRCRARGTLGEVFGAGVDATGIAESFCLPAVAERYLRFQPCLEFGGLM